MKRSLICLLCTLAWLSNAGPIFAQTAPKPAVVISLASPDKLFSDMNFLAKSAEAEQIVAVAQFMAQQYLQMMDTKLPAGIMVDMEQGEPKGLAFLPVNNYPRMKEMLTAQFAKPQDQGGGIDKMDLGQPVFMKPQGSFVFVSSTLDRLRSLPANPVAMLDGLDKQYAIAIRCNVQSVPIELRQTMITEMRQQFEREMAEGADGPEGEIAERVGRNTLKQLTSVVEEAQTATAGWAIDQRTGKTYIDMSVTATPGTKMAQKMNLMSRATTAFTGFNLPGAAAELNFATTMGPEQIQHNIDLMESFEATLMKEIADEDESTKREAAALFADVMKVMKETIAAGRTDGGAVLLLSDTAPKLQMAAGAFVANGAELDQAFRKTMELAKSKGDVPQVNFNAAVYKGVKFHTMSVERLDEDAKKVFGGAMSVAVGFGNREVYFAIGGDPVQLLKKVIDKTSQPVPATPMEMRVSLTPIIRFAKSVDDAPAADAILTALGKSAGRDHLIISSQVIPNGLQYRLTVEDGVIRAISKASGVK